MATENSDVRRRNADFSRRTVTRIWQEVPAEDNPYLAEECRCHGYDILELARKRSFVDVLHLLFHGEIPSAEQAELLESLMICLINPGPRHPAARAAMNAAVSRANPAHLLPIGLSVLSGAHLGGEEVAAAMGFLKNHLGSEPGEVAVDLLQEQPPPEGDWHVAPGFGSRYGGIDPLSQKNIDYLMTLPASGEMMNWGQRFVAHLSARGLGWLPTGVAAAVLGDLGFNHLAGAGLFQLLCAPGILAHGLELARQPLTAMPFLDQNHYVIAPEAKKR